MGPWVDCRRSPRGAGDHVPRGRTATTNATSPGASARRLDEGAAQQLVAAPVAIGAEPAITIVLERAAGAAPRRRRCSKKCASCWRPRPSQPPDQAKPTLEQAIDTLNDAIDQVEEAADDTSNDVTKIRLLRLRSSLEAVEDVIETGWISCSAAVVAAHPAHVGRARDMAESEVRTSATPAASQPEAGEQKRSFALPSAYTILFILIVLVAVATWIVPAGTYEYNEDGEPLPGTYHEVDHEPQQILLDSLKAPINGLYGIEDETGNISFWNSGELFGAIDVALFIIVIGGFLGVTMKTGAINAGIARVVVA